MLTWSDLRARLFPWLWNKEFDTQLRDEVRAVGEQQEQLAPLIDAQTRYLVDRGNINGFTRQLQMGFRRRTAGE